VAEAESQKRSLPHGFTPCFAGCPTRKLVERSATARAQVGLAEQGTEHAKNLLPGAKNPLPANRLRRSASSDLLGKRAYEVESRKKGR
jgi:hypothetical protein